MKTTFTFILLVSNIHLEILRRLVKTSEIPAELLPFLSDQEGLCIFTIRNMVRGPKVVLDNKQFPDENSYLDEAEIVKVFQTENRFKEQIEVLKKFLHHFS